MKKSGFFVLIVLVIVTSAFNLFGQTPKNLKPIKSADLIKKGVKYYDDKKYEKAEEIFKLIPRNDTNYSIALYELALTYEAMEQFDQAIAIANKILQNNYLTNNKAQAYILLGNSLDGAKRTDEAISVYEKGLMEFPYNHQLYFNLGVAYFGKDDFFNAREAFIKSLKINSFHQRSHSLLGLCMIKMGQPVQGVMSLLMGGLINPKSSAGLNAITLLESYFNNEIEVSKDKEKFTFPEEESNSCFPEIEMLIQSDFASNKKFKVESKINSAVIRQAYLLMSKLKTQKGSQGVWNDFYIPFYKDLYESGYFETFSFFYLSGIENENIDNWCKKNESKIDKFVTWASSFIRTKRSFNLNAEIEKKKNLLYYYDEDGDLSYIGTFADAKFSKPEGDFSFFNSLGAYLKKGKYVNGQMNGHWLTYHKFGNVDEDVNYVNGELDGHVLKYHDNGELYIDADFQKGQFHGLYQEYNQSGVLVEKIDMEKGKYNGKKYDYYPHGQLYAESEYKVGKRNGVYKRYYAKGTIDLQVSYKNDLLEGEYIEYYLNGQIYSKGNFKNDLRVGQWVDYHYNGKVKEEGSYSEKGKKIGVWKEYYSSGLLESVVEYSASGKQNGEAKYYDEKGNLVSTYFSKNEILTEVVYWTSDKKERARFTVKKGVMNLITYDINGVVESSGKLVDGKREGLWKFYDANGLLASERNYKDGLLDGEYKAYFPNGTISTYSVYEKGDRNGLYQDYFRNGFLLTEGYFKNDRKEGQWYSYYKNGNISSITNYLNGDKDGFYEEYDFSGKKRTETFYKKDLLMQNSLLDSTGRIYSIDSLKNGNGVIKRYNQNGSLAMNAEFKSGLWKDTVVTYNMRGIKTFVGFYVNGVREGVSRSYDDFGVLKSEIQFQNGDNNGPAKFYNEEGKLEKLETYINDRLEKIDYYYPNGKLKSELEYQNGDRNGYSKYYAPDGALAIMIFYKDNQVVGYSYKGKDGKILDMIPLNKGTGNVVAYFPSGKKSSEMEFLNGERVGKLIYYFSTGAKRLETSYENGRENGLSKEWNQNGVLIAEEYYQDDDLNGTAKYFNDNGTLKRQENYVYDDLHGDCYYYDKSGKLTKVLTYYYDDLIGERKK